MTAQNPDWKREWKVAKLAKLLTSNTGFLRYKER